MNKNFSERKTPTELYTVRLICKCGTEMKYVQQSQKDKMPVFVHQCPGCKHKEVLGKAYPYLEYKEKEKKGRTKTDDLSRDQGNG